MKKLSAAVFGILMVMSMIATAQSWKELQDNGNSTYLGGFYAATSYACLGTDYTDNSGSWASGDATISYEKGCAKAVWDSLFASVETPSE